MAAVGVSPCLGLEPWSWLPHVLTCGQRSNKVCLGGAERQGVRVRYGPRTAHEVLLLRQPLQRTEQKTIMQAETPAQCTVPRAAVAAGQPVRRGLAPRLTNVGRGPTRGGLRGNPLACMVVPQFVANVQNTCTAAC